MTRGYRRRIQSAWTGQTALDWHPSTRHSFTGGTCSPRDSFTGGHCKCKGKLCRSSIPVQGIKKQQKALSMAQAERNLHSPPGNASSGAGLGPGAHATEQSPGRSWNQQQIERGWDGSRPAPSSPVQPRRPHRLHAMSTDGGLSMLHAQPSAPRWSPSLMYQEELERSPDGWAETNTAQRYGTCLLVT